MITIDLVQDPNDAERMYKVRELTKEEMSNMIMCSVYNNKVYVFLKGDEKQVKTVTEKGMRYFLGE